MEWSGVCGATTRLFQHTEAGHPLHATLCSAKVLKNAFMIGSNHGGTTMRMVLKNRQKHGNKDLINMHGHRKVMLFLEK
ncbi:MAG TPA: hypothetical protein DHV38_07275 [Corynebacterium casei]|nr:hypothetical protein [Corynebacterium casei]